MHTDDIYNIYIGLNPSCNLTILQIPMRSHHQHIHQDTLTKHLSQTTYINLILNEIHFSGPGLLKSLPGSCFAQNGSHSHHQHLQGVER